MFSIDSLFTDSHKQISNDLDKNGIAVKGKIVEGIVVFSDTLLVGDESIFFYFYSKDVFKVIDEIRNKVIFLQQQPFGTDLGLEQILPEDTGREIGLMLDVVDNN